MKFLISTRSLCLTVLKIFLIQVKYWLSHIQSFSEYPRRMQQKLIQVGWYERYVRLHSNKGDGGVAKIRHVEWQ
jgi:hypothetical protein